MILTKQQIDSILARVQGIMSIDGVNFGVMLRDQALYPQGYALTCSIENYDDLYKMHIRITGPNDRIILSRSVQASSKRSIEQFEKSCAQTARFVMMSIIQYGIMGMSQDLKS